MTLKYICIVSTSLHSSKAPFPVLLDQFCNSLQHLNQLCKMCKIKPTFHYNYYLFFFLILSFNSIYCSTLLLVNFCWSLAIILIFLLSFSCFLLWPSLASSQFPVGFTSAEVNSLLLMQVLHQNFKASHRNHCTINLLSDFLSLCVVLSDYFIKAWLQYH